MEEILSEQLQSLLFEIIRVLLGMLGGGTTLYFIQAYIERRKRGAEASKTEEEAGSIATASANTVTRTAIELMASMKKDLDDLRKESDRQAEKIEKLSKQVSTLLASYRILYRGAASLIEQITALGHKPVFTLESVPMVKLEYEPNNQ